MTRIPLFFALFAPLTVAFAQEETPPYIQYQDRTTIDFDEVDVKGERLQPGTSLVIERRQAEFHPLIRLRETFNDELVRSIDHVK